MPAKPAALWTPEQDAILRRDYERLGASRIGQALGKNRNSVIGRAFRLGLTARRPKGKQAVKRWLPKLAAPAPPKGTAMLQRKDKKRRTPPQEVPADPWQALAGCPPVAIVDLSPLDCRWPVEGGSCGCVRDLPASPYCATHRDIAVRGMTGVRYQPFQPPAAIR